MTFLMYEIGVRKGEWEDGKKAGKMRRYLYMHEKGR